MKEGNHNMNNENDTRRTDEWSQEEPRRRQDAPSQGLQGPEGETSFVTSAPSPETEDRLASDSARPAAPSSEDTPFTFGTSSSIADAGQTGASQSFGSQGGPSATDQSFGSQSGQAATGQSFSSQSGQAATGQSLGSQRSAYDYSSNGQSGCSSSSQQGRPVTNPGAGGWASGSGYSGSAGSQQGCQTNNQNRSGQQAGYDGAGQSRGYGQQPGYGQQTSYGSAGQQPGYGQQRYGTNGQDAFSQQAQRPAGYSASSIPPEPPKRSRREKKAKAQTVITMSRRGFVLLLIICMLVTSALTFGGFMYYTNKQPGTATNYTLTKSEETLSYTSIIKKTENSVVSITTESVSTDQWAQNYVTQGAGSGVIIQSNGYIMTCNHVISGATKITVTLKNKKSYSAKVVGTDADNDIAILKINATGLTAATYGDSSDLEVGDQVVAIGNPLGQLGGTATTGIISALNRNLTIDGKSLNLLQTDASINPGNSGGALFNASGNLVGIVVAKSSGSDVEGLGFAIPINKAASIGKKIITTGKSISTDSQTTSDANTPKIGVTVSELTESEAQQEGLQDGAGLYIQSVTNGNAQKAGLKAADKIVSVDGTKISTYDDLHSLLQKHKKGDTIRITVSRSGQTETVTCTLS